MITVTSPTTLSPSVPLPLKPPNYFFTSLPATTKPKPFVLIHHTKFPTIKVKANDHWNFCNSLLFKEKKWTWFLFMSFVNVCLQRKKKIDRGICRAELSDDTPFAVAIGACMLSSLLLPNTVTATEAEEGDSGITTTDTRFAVMGIISFIPYFNWLVSLSLCFLMFSCSSFVFLRVFLFWIFIKVWSFVVVLLAELGVCLAWYWEKKICCLCPSVLDSIFEVCILFYCFVFIVLQLVNDEWMP